MIQGSITIRDAGKEDVEIVAWTVLTALDMDTDEMEKFIKSCSKDDSIYSWRNAIVATLDGTAVGCLIAYEGSRYKELRDKSWLQLWDDMDSEYLKTIEDEAVDGEFYLDSMAILPEYRGRSIGRELMAYAIEKGKALGCGCATLLVDVHKPRLEAYYQAMGFEQYGEMEYFGHDYKRMRYAK